MKFKTRTNMTRLCFSLFIVLPFLLLVIPAASYAGLNADVKLALHVRPHLAKASCSTSGITGCGDIVTSAPAQDNDYDVYVIATNAAELRTYEFGISYPESETNGIKVWSWRNCGGFELPSTGFPGPGAGVVVSRDSCSTPADGFVVLGIFYLTAYGTGGRFSLSGSPRNGKVEVGDCAGVIDSVTDLGFADFGEGSGYNPCFCDTAGTLSLELLWEFAPDSLGRNWRVTQNRLREGKVDKFPLRSLVLDSGWVFRFGEEGIPLSERKYEWPKGSSPTRHFMMLFKSGDVFAVIPSSIEAPPEAVGTVRFLDGAGNLKVSRQVPEVHSLHARISDSDYLVCMSSDRGSLNVFTSEGKELLGVRTWLGGGAFGRGVLPFDACGDYAASLGLDIRGSVDPYGLSPYDKKLIVYDVRTGLVAWERSFEKNSIFLPLYLKFSADGAMLILYYPAARIRDGFEDLRQTRVDAHDSATGALLWSRPIKPSDHTEEVKRENKKMSFRGLAVSEGAKLTALYYEPYSRKPEGELLLLDERGNVVSREQVPEAEKLCFVEHGKYFLLTRPGGGQLLYAIR
ncbi:MAG: hypothetical protein QME66_12320 [Candidatus Eisenbacteria bacterium]|nr:hypothetical protein [Candidatus Eisenbacteria bacterium]